MPRLLTPRLTLSALLLAASLFALSACSDEPETVDSNDTSVPQEAASEPELTPERALSNIAEQVVPQFHLSYLDGLFADIWGGADPEMQKRISQKDFVAYLEAVRSRMGPVQSANRTDTKVEGNVVTLRYASTFSGGGAVEEFVARVEGENARLLSYRMISPDIR